MAPPTVSLNIALLAPRRTAEQIRDQEKVSIAVSLYRRGLASLEAAAKFADVPMACLLAAMPDGEAPRRSDEELGRDAQRYIAIDTGILSGTPCVKGSRVPARLIADMVANGDSVREISAAYPYLTESKIHAAVAYTRAYPRRARPVMEEPPWRMQQPIASNEVPLDDLPKSP